MKRKSRRAESDRHFVIGISGSSGPIYAVRLARNILRNEDCHLHLTVTPAGLRVMKDELGSRKTLLDYFEFDADARRRIQVYPCADIGATIASGTFRTDGMVVVPCSMNTLAAVAHGLESNLLLRAAAVTLKEGRPLILVPRETPLSLIELRNAVAAAEGGAVILPADPGFYHKPKTIDDLVNFVVQKIMDRLGVAMEEAYRWGERQTSKRIP